MKIETNSKTIEFGNTGYITRVTINYRNGNFKSVQILKGTQVISIYSRDDFINLLKLLEEANEYIKEKI